MTRKRELHGVIVTARALEREIRLMYKEHEAGRVTPEDIENRRTRALHTLDELGAAGDFADVRNMGGQVMGLRIHIRMFYDGLQDGDPEYHYLTLLDILDDIVEDASENLAEEGKG